MTKWKQQPHKLFAAFLILIALVACRSSDDNERQEYKMPSLSPVSLDTDQKLDVVAATSIVADVVEQIGGDRLKLKTLLPLGADPHAFEPTPQDVVAVSDAHVIFANGLGLEEFLDPLLESAEATDKAVHVSHGIELEHENELESDHHDHDADPHTWTDPNYVILWTRTIEAALSALDPANAETYAANAETYRAALTELDAWVRGQVAQVPRAKRQIVTDHLLFAHFADRYGFTQVGAIVPGYSTMSEPSAKELAELQDAIHDLGVQAIFVGNTVNPDLAQRVAQDTGVQLIFLYTGSLTKKGGPADNYLDYIHYNVNAIVNALK